MDKLNNIGLFLCAMLLLTACSVERSNLVSTGFHNMAARYNAYFYARERMNEVENAIENNHQNNFNEILNIYSDVDSSVIRSMQEPLEESIKKASIAIQRHPNSKWVDDSYILIGKARYYLADFVNSIETFKYVNTKSVDDDARHTALVWLMRAFLDYNEENNAIAVSDYLKKEKLNNRNEGLLELNRAYLYQKREDMDEMVKHLVKIAPQLTKKENAARIYFIIAQVYQEKGFDAEAYNYYSECLKRNPEYELSFYTKLYMAQVTELAVNSDVKKIRKYFRKLLKDKKNEEFKDKIYYEMANFEIKQKNTKQAIFYYKKSIESSVSNPRQKAYSYLKLGEIYFEQLKNYETAKSYYDSTVAVLPKDDDLYDAVSERQVILDNFVEQVNTIQLQDSLLILANMDTSSLYAYLDLIIEEKKRLAEEEEKRKKQQRVASVSQRDVFNPFSNNNTFTASTGSGSTWYFYNQNAVSLGQSEFKMIWGDRPLEDHWRRSNKSSTSAIVQETGVIPADQTTAIPEESSSLPAGKSREQYLSTIPFKDEEKEIALSKIESAYYNLGKIYNFDLEEPVNAAETFETLLQRFPDTENKAEVLYLLYLIYKEVDDARYGNIAEQLTSEFPNTIYAKLILNPNYKEDSNIASEKLKKYYKEAYDHYLLDSIGQALALVDEGMEQYPDNTFSDNMELLKIMLLAKQDGIYKYQYELQQFDNRYPESELIDYVEELLLTSEDYQKKQATEKEIKYIPYFDQEHFFIVLYPKKGELSESLLVNIEDFNNEYAKDYNLETGNLVFNDEYSLILINEFDNKSTAITYYDTFNQDTSPLNKFSSYKFYNFVISKDNFQILYQTKGLEEYLNFFEKNYL